MVDFVLGGFVYNNRGWSYPGLELIQFFMPHYKTLPHKNWTLEELTLLNTLAMSQLYTINSTKLYLFSTLYFLKINQKL